MIPHSLRLQLADGATEDMTAIGSYKMGRKLGTGTFGTVRVAEHSETGERVAVKVVPKPDFNPQFVDGVAQGLEKEVEAFQLMGAAHSNVLRLIEIVDTPSHTFLALEWASEGDLLEFLIGRGASGLREIEARRIFRMIISAVRHLHSRMLIHRDLKAENVLLDAGCKVKLADFGLAGRLRDGIFHKTSCGSPNYAAPELHRGRAYAGPEVDVWSCGVLLYALLCNNLPFDEPTHPELRRKIIRGDYKKPGNMNAAARDLIARQLSVDPTLRSSLDDVSRHEWYVKDTADDHRRLSITPNAGGLCDDNLNDLLSDYEIQAPQVEGGRSRLGTSAPAPEPPPDTGWRLGIEARLPGSRLMTLVLQALLNLGYEWFHIDPFRVAARPALIGRRTASVGSAAECAEGDQEKGPYTLVIQVFRVASDNKEHCVVDVLLSDGPALLSAVAARQFLWVIQGFVDAEGAG